MKTFFTITGIIILILGVGYVATSSDSDPASTPNDPASTPEPVVTDNDTGETTSDPEEMATNEPENEPSDPGTYQDYDAEQIANSDADRIFLSFYATWCPSCRALEADIQANAASIPPDVEIYKVDYDTATALKRQYNITMQHSIIEIDSDGTAVSSITHPATLSALVTP